MDRLGNLVVELWTAMGEGSAVDTRRMSEWFRQMRLSSAERSDVLAGFHRLVRLQRRLDYVLAGACDLRGEAVGRARWLACELIEGRLTLEDVAGTSLRVDWPRVLQNDRDLLAEKDPVRRLALRHSLPDGIARRLVLEYGDEVEALAAAMAQTAPTTVRANLIVQDREALAARLHDEGIGTRETRHADQGLVLTSKANLFRLQSFQDGCFEVQDEGSQLIATVTAPPPGSTVVDVCAGSGGKTLALASMLRGKGHVVALDVAEFRLVELRQRARRARAANVRALTVGEDEWPKEVTDIARQAARILVDAPCSGTGAWRRHPEARWKIGEQELQRLVATQQHLLNAALAVVKPGARVIYATCSLLREENEAIVESALGQDPALALVPVKEILGSARALPISDDSGTYLKVAPHRHDTDGFFAAVLRRR